MDEKTRPSSPDSNDSRVSWCTERSQLNTLQAMEEEMRIIRKDMVTFRAQLRKSTVAATENENERIPKVPPTIVSWEQKMRKSVGSDDLRSAISIASEKRTRRVSWISNFHDNKIDQDPYSLDPANNDDLIDLDAESSKQSFPFSDPETAQPRVRRRYSDISSRKPTSSIVRTFRRSLAYSGNSNAMEIPLRNDTFSLMMISSPFSTAWVLGTGTFLFESILGGMIIWNQVSRESVRSSSLNIPIMVEVSVSIGQFFAIILSIISQDDLFISIQTFISLEMESNWNEVIQLKSKKTKKLWWQRIAIPNGMKFLLGVMVTIMSFVLIIQSENIIDLITNVSALLVISSADIFLFGMAEQGYLGERLQGKTAKVNDVNVDDRFLLSTLSRVERKKSYRIRAAIFIGVFMTIVVGWGTFLFLQLNGTFFRQKYPDCVNHFNETYFYLAKEHFGDDKCYGGPLNSLECGFEGGECANFNAAYPLCKGDDLIFVEEEVGNGECNKAFATSSCDFDGGDCCSQSITRSREFGNGQCNGGIISTDLCGNDNGDCLSFIRDFPDCSLDELAKQKGSSSVILGDGICDNTVYASRECGYEYGDCDIGQTGQDIQFSGISQGSSLYFHTRMSLDGSRIIIGMPFTADVVGEKTSKFDRENSQGKVLIYGYDANTETWSKEDEIIGERGSKTGIGIAMNRNGTIVAVGAPAHKGVGNVQTFKFNLIENNRMHFSKAIDGSRPELTGVGYRVDMTGDGTRLAIAAPLSNHSKGTYIYNGKIQIFEMDSLSKLWVQLGDDILGKRSIELVGRFGLLLNSSGSRVFFSSTTNSERIGLPGVGASVRAYEYDETSSQRWFQLGNDLTNPHPSTQAFTINTNGDRIAVASNSLMKSRPGQVQVFDLNTSQNNTEWVQLGPALFGVSRRKGDGFGYATSMNADGSVLAISSIEQDCAGIPEFCATGSIQLYHYKPTNHPRRPFARVPLKLFPRYGNTMQLSQRSKDKNIMGLQLSLSADGSRMSVGGYDFIRDLAFINVYEVDELFYSKCVVPNIDSIGDGICDWNEPYYTEECFFDGGDCAKPEEVPGYEGCFVNNIRYVLDEFCNDYPPQNTEICGFDGGKCPDHKMVEKYKNCFVSYPELIGNGECDDRPPYNGYSCGFDGGDCM